MLSSSVPTMYPNDYSNDCDSEVAHLNSKSSHINNSDTEDASEDGSALGSEGAEETDTAKSSANGSTVGGPAIKEQVYMDKLEQLKTELKKLEDGCHPEYLVDFDKVQRINAERERANEIEYDYQMQIFNNDFVNEQRAAVREFEEKKTELKENLLIDLAKQKEQIESERGMELTPDSPEKPAITRKLRRRANDPVPIPEKRRKLPQSQITFLLEDNSILEDLNVLRHCHGQSPTKRSHAHLYHQQRSPAHDSSDSSSRSSSPLSSTDARIEDGKLFYEKRWYHRGQPIYVEGKETPRLSGVIGGISQDAVWVRKLGDNSSKLRVPLLDLVKGRFVIKRRA